MTPVVTSSPFGNATPVETGLSDSAALLDMLDAKRPSLRQQHCGRGVERQLALSVGSCCSRPQITVKPR